jgi:hypothetical protein
MNNKENDSLKGKIRIAGIAVILFCLSIGLISYQISRNLAQNSRMNMFPFIEIMIVILIITCYFLIVIYKSQTTYAENRLLQISDWTTLDPRYRNECELDLSVPFERAFQQSKLAVQLLPSAEIIDENIGTGIIHAKSEKIFNGGISLVRFTLGKTGVNSTRIHIQCVYTDVPYVNRVPPGEYTKITNDQNARIISTLTKYLMNPSATAEANLSH